MFRSGFIQSFDIHWNLNLIAFKKRVFHHAAVEIQRNTVNTYYPYIVKHLKTNNIIKIIMHLAFF